LVTILLAVSNMRYLAAVTEDRGLAFQEFRWMLVNRVYPDSMLATVHPNSVWARAIFQELDQHGWSIFSYQEARWIGTPLKEVARAQSTECLGFFDAKQPLAADAPYTRAEGWSYDVRLNRAAEYVVITDSSDTVRAVGRSATDRPDVMKAHPLVRVLRTGWLAYVANRYPLEGYRAYAFLRRQGNYAACRLQ
jgi:hypothetical protein